MIGAAPTSAGVDDVGDRNELFLIFVVERQAPHFFAGLRVRAVEAVVHVVVIGENSCVVVTERDYDRTRQRRGVYQMRATELRA